VDLSTIELDLPDGFNAIFGLAIFDRVCVCEAQSSLKTKINYFIHKVLEGQELESALMLSRKEAVRMLLRQGGFKPAGRNRPANEYLLRQLMESKCFNFILNLVDINNYLSLKYFLPMSILDAEKFVGRLHLRLGRADEEYVFNPAGQSIDLEGLIVVADLSNSHSIPLGSPVKDSMRAKITKQTKNVLVVVYSPAGSKFRESV